MMTKHQELMMKMDALEDALGKLVNALVKVSDRQEKLEKLILGDRAGYETPAQAGRPPTTRHW